MMCYLFDNPNQPVHPMKRVPKHSALILLAAAVLLISLTGCNTVRGVGRDVQKVGSGIQRVAG